jgi:beta-fructofuranosidase
MWECPTFFPLGERHVLIVSALPQKRVLAFIGSYVGNRFIPETWRWVDGGSALYAPQVMRDQQHRRLFFAWIKEERDTESQKRSGWSGILSLPRVIHAGDGSSLAMEPVPEFTQLRMNPRTVRQEVHDQEHILLPTNQHGQWEVEAIIDQTEGVLTLRLEEAGGRTLTTIEVDLARRYARLGGDESTTGWTPFTAAAETPIRLHCFFDHSVLECFVQNQLSLTKRVYPSRKGGTRMTLSFVGDQGGAHVEARTWDLRDASCIEALAV